MVWGECGVPGSPALVTCIPVRPHTALGWIHAQDLEACLGHWHRPGCWLTHPSVLQASACPTARGEPVDGEGSVPGPTLAPSSWPAAAYLQAQCWSPQPPLPAPLSLGGTGQQRGYPRTGMGIAGDAGAALHQPSRVLSFPSPSSGRVCVAPGALCSPLRFGVVPVPARASPRCCPMSTGPQADKRWVAGPASHSRPRCRAAVEVGAGGWPAAPRLPQRAVAGQRAGEGEGCGWCYLPGTKRRHRLLK